MCILVCFTTNLFLFNSSTKEETQENKVKIEQDQTDLAPTPGITGPTAVKDKKQQEIELLMRQQEQLKNLEMLGKLQQQQKAFAENQAPQVRKESLDEAPQVREESMDKAPDVRNESMGKAPQIRKESMDEAPQVRNESVDVLRSEERVPEERSAPHGRCRL